MKRNVILLINADPQVEAAATEAVKGTDQMLRVANDSEKAFGLLCEGIGDVAMIVLDLSHKIHGLTLLHAVQHHEEIPLVALTDLEKAYMEPLVKRKGAVACLEKPITAEKLREQIEHFCGSSGIAR